MGDQATILVRKDESLNWSNRVRNGQIPGTSQR